MASQKPSHPPHAPSSRIPILTDPQVGANHLRALRIDQGGSFESDSAGGIKGGVSTRSSGVRTVSGGFINARAVPSYARGTESSRRASAEMETDPGRRGRRSKRYTDPTEMAQRFETLLLEKERKGPTPEKDVETTPEKVVEVAKTATTSSSISEHRNEAIRLTGRKELTVSSSAPAGDFEVERSEVLAFPTRSPDKRHFHARLESPPTLPQLSTAASSAQAFKSARQFKYDYGLQEHDPPSVLSGSSFLSRNELRFPSQVHFYGAGEQELSGHGAGEFKNEFGSGLEAAGAGFDATREVSGNENERNAKDGHDEVSGSSSNGDTQTVPKLMHDQLCTAECSCRLLIADLQRLVQAQDANATRLESIINSQQAAIVTLRSELETNISIMTNGLLDKLELISEDLQEVLAGDEERLVVVEKRTNQLMELALITITQNDESFIGTKNHSDLIKPLASRVNVLSSQVTELRRELTNATQRFATASSNESPTPQGTGLKESIAPPTIPRTPIALIRSQWDSQYKSKNDPLCQRQSGVHFERSQQGQSATLAEIGDETHDTHFVRKNLPTVKELPIFSGRHQSENSVTLPTFFRLLILMRQARKCSDHHITSLFSSILKDDALQLYTTTFDLESESEKWTLEEWYQRFLSHYHTASYLSDLRAEKMSYRYPKSEPDPHTWASTFLAKCIDIDRALTVDAFVEAVQLNVKEPLRSKLSEKHQQNRFKTHLEVTMAFGRMAEKQKSNERSVARELSHANDNFSPYQAVPSGTPALSSTPDSAATVAAPNSGSLESQRAHLKEMKDSLVKQRKCYGCGETGHIRLHCPNPDKLKRLGEVGAITDTFFQDEEKVEDLLNEMEDSQEERGEEKGKKVAAAYWMSINQEIDED